MSATAAPSVSPLCRLAAVCQQLIAHYLEPPEIVAYARCSSSLLATISAPFALSACPIVRVTDEQMRRAGGQRGVLRGARLRFRFEETGSSDGFSLDPSVLATLSLPLFELTLCNLHGLTASVAAQLLHHPTLHQLQSLRLGRQNVVFQIARALIVSAVVDAIFALPSLRSLHIGCSTMQSAHLVGESQSLSLTWLSLVDVRDDEGTSLALLRRCPNVTRFELYDASLASLYSHLPIYAREWSRLQECTLHDAGERFRHQCHLVGRSVSPQRVLDTFFAALSSMHTLHLRNVTGTNAFVRSVQLCPSIRWLHLDMENDIDCMDRLRPFRSTLQVQRIRG